MSDSAPEKLILYTSNFCGHSRLVERLLNQNEIPVTKINIDRDPDARQSLIAINGGYASVPTLIFPDGSKMTEPPMRQLKARLGIEEKGALERLREWFGGDL
jgi:mycoredoxin